MNTIRIQTEPFDLRTECEALAKSSAGIGALVTFTGQVRDDGGLIALTLEHYPGMTEREIARHVEEAHARWPLLGATVVHRVGRLLPGDGVVFVGVASAHRKAAFAAAEFLMDYLKTRAPLWKKEERTAGTQWVEAKYTDDAAAARWRCGRVQMGKRTTSPGYENINKQVVVAATDLPGTHPNQQSYRLKCLICGHTYLANGCDIHNRRCPAHDTGASGDGPS
jgi:molybdopterin synthase catalytic subunit